MLHYVTNSDTVADITHVIPVFGDHVLAIAELNLKLKSHVKPDVQRNWSRYTCVPVLQFLLYAKY